MEYKPVSASDRTACSEVLKKHIAEKYTLLKKRAMSFLDNPTDAEDALQNACLKAWSRLSDLHTPFACASWFDRILTNECLLMLRQRKSKPVFSCETDLDTLCLPNDEYETSLNRWLLEGMFASLNRHYSLPLILFYALGFSIKTIAKILDISPRSVRHRINYGKNILRSKYPNL